MAPAAASGIDGLPAPLVLLDGRRVVAANPAACAELGREVHQLLGTGLIDTLEVESATTLATLLDRPWDKDEPSRRLIVRRDGGADADDFFEFRLQPFGGPTVCAAVLDVTERHRLDAAIAALGNATVAIDTSSSLVWRPFGNAGRFGVADQDVVGALVLEWVHPEELSYLLQQFAHLQSEPGCTLTDMIRMRHPHIEGAWLYTRVTAVNCLSDPALRAIVVRTEDAGPFNYVNDITRTTGPFRSLAESTPVGIVVTDGAGAVLYRNELARELLHLDYDIVGRTDWLASFSSDTAEQLERVLSGAREDMHPGAVVVSLDTDDVARWLRVDAVPQVDEAGRPIGLVATLLDVTSETEARAELAEARDRLWHLATHDPLTNLANRVLFRERIESALAARTGDDDGVTLLYCDLDGFKSVNDRFGHSVGDQVLCQVADRLRAAVRAGDLVGRFGGDEFLVLCCNLSNEAEVAVTGRLREAVAAPMTVDGEPVLVGMTVGMARASMGAGVDDLISRADRAMYDNKAGAARRD